MADITLDEYELANEECYQSWLAGLPSLSNTQIAEKIEREFTRRELNYTDKPPNSGFGVLRVRNPAVGGICNLGVLADYFKLLKSRMIPLSQKKKHIASAESAKKILTRYCQRAFDLIRPSMRGCCVAMPMPDEDPWIVARSIIYQVLDGHDEKLSLKLAKLAYCNLLSCHQETEDCWKGPRTFAYVESMCRNGETPLCNDVVKMIQPYVCGMIF